MEKEKHPNKKENQSETICATMNEKNESEDKNENELLSIKIHSSLSSNENEHLNELNDADEATMNLRIEACIPKDLNPDQQRVWQQLAWQQMPDFDPFDEEHEKLCLKQHNGRKLSAQSREIWNNWAASKRRSKQNLSASPRFRGMDKMVNATTISSLEQNPANYSFYGIGRKLWKMKNGLLFGAAALTLGGMVYYGNNLLSENPIEYSNQRHLTKCEPGDFIQWTQLVKTKDGYQVLTENGEDLKTGVAKIMFVQYYGDMDVSMWKRDFKTNTKDGETGLNPDGHRMTKCRFSIKQDKEGSMFKEYVPDEMLKAGDWIRLADEQKDINEKDITPDYEAFEAATTGIPEYFVSEILTVKDDRYCIRMDGKYEDRAHEEFAGQSFTYVEIKRNAKLEEIWMKENVDGDVPAASALLRSQSQIPKVKQSEFPVGQSRSSPTVTKNSDVLPAPQTSSVAQCVPSMIAAVVVVIVVFLMN